MVHTTCTHHAHAALPPFHLVPRTHTPARILLVPQLPILVLVIITSSFLPLPLLVRTRTPRTHAHTTHTSSVHTHTTAPHAHTFWFVGFVRLGLCQWAGTLVWFGSRLVRWFPCPLFWHTTYLFAHTVTHYTTCTFTHTHLHARFTCTVLPPPHARSVHTHAHRFPMRFGCVLAYWLRRTRARTRIHLSKTAVRAHTYPPWIYLFCIFIIVYCVLFAISAGLIRLSLLIFTVGVSQIQVVSCMSNNNNNNIWIICMLIYVS